MNTTPRTDLMVSGNSDPSSDEYADLADFARQLERESDALRLALALVESERDEFAVLLEKNVNAKMDALKQAEDLKRERDEARKAALARVEAETARLRAEVAAAESRVARLAQDRDKWRESAEVRCRLLSQARDEAEKAKAENGFGFHWIMAHCTEAVEMYEEHIEGYNTPQPPVTTEEAVIADLEAKLAALAAEVESLRADKVLLDQFETLRQDDVQSHQISEDEAEHELVGHIWSTISAQTCDVREAIRQSLDAARSDAARTHAQEPKP